MDGEKETLAPLLEVKGLIMALEIDCMRISCILCIEYFMSHVIYGKQEHNNNRSFSQ